MNHRPRYDEHWGQRTATAIHPNVPSPTNTPIMLITSAGTAKALRGEIDGKIVSTVAGIRR
jgi:hypothetical protein